MSALLLFVVLGCSGAPEPLPRSPDGTFPSVEMLQGASTDAIPLHLRLDEATFALADSNLPEGFRASGAIEIPLDPNRSVERTSLPLPFELDAESRARFGKDLTVMVDGRRFRYAPLGGGGRTWQLLKDRIILTAGLNDKVATLVYTGADALTKNRILSASGRTPAAFVESSLTLSGQTVPGLMLTSPSSVSWTLTVPPHSPRFRATTSILPAILRGESSDGLQVSLEIDVDGTTTSLATKTLQEVAFSSWEVDLSDYAGKTVDLRLKSTVTGTPDHDYAFIGAPTIWGVPEQETRRVIVIGLDTTRRSSIGWFGYPRPTTPELDHLIDESAVAVNAWTPAPRTRPSFRSATTGRYPLLAVGATTIGEVFQENGFATAGFVANIHLLPRFNFDAGFDTWTFDGRADADQQVDSALKWFKENTDRDTYMFLHFMDPHLFYNAPGSYRTMFVDDPDPSMPRRVSRWQVSRWIKDGTLTEQRKAHLIGLYDGEMRFMSDQIGRLVKEIDALPGKTTIVVHSDHGEEFFEHGGFEHNHTLYDELTRALLILRPPGGTKEGPVRLDQNATLADIAPTLYDMMGFKNLPETDGISLLPYAKGKPSTPRDIGIGHLRYGLDRYAVVHEGHKYIVWTGSGREELYDLEHDPLEQKDLAATNDLTIYRSALIGAHPGLQGGWGWRIDLKGQIPSIKLALSGDPLNAGVLHPDASSSNRPNLAWGEAPHRGPESVGTIAIQDRSLSFTSAGSNGQLWVLFKGTVQDPTSIEWNGESIPLLAGTDGSWIHRFSTGGTIAIRSSMVIVPAPGEAARMKELGDVKEEVTSDETCRLCELGYIEGPSCDGC